MTTITMPQPAAPTAAATTQECGRQTMEKMHASDTGAMTKSGHSMKSGCMSKDKGTAATAGKPDEQDHSAHAHK